MAINPKKKARLIHLALAHADRHTDPATGMIRLTESTLHPEREQVYAALGFFLSEAPERIAQGKELLRKTGTFRDHFSLNAAILALHRMPEHLDETITAQFRESVRQFIGVPAEDIIAGRNINIPLQHWAIRIAAGHWFDRPDLVSDGVDALQRLTELVEDHGTIPEFNSPVYHTITFQVLQNIVDVGEPGTAAMAQRLKDHLWMEVAWRFHPRLRVPGGPWSRVYHDGLAGGGSSLSVLFDLIWGAHWDEEIPHAYDHGAEFSYAPLLLLFAENVPLEAVRIATEKELPVTVVSRAEQVDFQLGDAWAPGGVAEVTTWLDKHFAVGTASRSHVHAMQNGTYIAQWSRTDEPVTEMRNLGQAFTRFAQNGRRPGGHNLYRNHQRGESIRTNKSLWADDGRPFALQSGPAALILYTPKSQERRYMRSLEMFMAIPRLGVVDEVLIEGEPVGVGYEGAADGSVVLRSGCISLGLRFAACDRALTEPVLVVEECHDHLLIGLRLVQYPEERELGEGVYRRYGGSIGSFVCHTPNQAAVDAFMESMRAAILTDRWWMGDAPVALGGPREVALSVDGRTLRGRYAPVAETWLSQRVPVPAGNRVEIEL